MLLSSFSVPFKIFASLKRMKRGLQQYEDSLHTRQFAPQIVIVMRAKYFFNQRQCDDTDDLRVDVVQLQIELFDAFVVLLGHIDIDQMILVQENEPMFTGHHVFQLVAIVAFNYRHKSLHQAHECYQMNFIPVT
jgi:hypothetical protein